MTTRVYKFGGSSLGSPERIAAVADKIAADVGSGQQVTVVVSAMGSETDRLLELARQVADTPAPRELDALLATGEQASAALLCMALLARGLKACSLNGSQVPIHTNGDFGKARIEEVGTEAVRQRLDQGCVPVVTGYQGLDREHNINTLGRGGSDTSAVALAVALQAEECRIYTDVDGVYTADPRIVAGARRLPTIGFEEMLEMASLGSKVLHHRAVELAARKSMPLRVLSSMQPGEGTLITEIERAEEMERPTITAVNHQPDEAKITVRGILDQPGLAARVLAPMAEANINVDSIVQNVGNGSTDLSFTVPSSDLAEAKRLLLALQSEVGASEIITDSGIAKVSVVGIGMRSHAGVARRMFETLANESINIQMISTSEIKITVIIDEKYLELAVRSLHTAFGLDEASGNTQ